MRSTYTAPYVTAIQTLPTGVELRLTLALWVAQIPETRPGWACKIIGGARLPHDTEPVSLIKAYV